jgi:hypothetical protein
VKKTLLSLAGALLLLAAILLIKDFRDKAAAKPRYVFKTPVEEVTSLTLAYQQDSITVLRLGGTGRWVNAADSFPADTALLFRVLDRVLAVQNRERVSRSADTARLAEYGLSAAEAKRAAWTRADGTRESVLLGKTSGTDYASTYWKFEDQPEVYLTPGSFTHEIPAGANNWKDRNLFPFFVYEDVQSVEVDWIDGSGARVHYKLERGTGDTGYVMTLPNRTPLPRANAVKVFEQTPQFVVDAFVDSLDPRLLLAGPDESAITVRTVMKNGEVRALQVGPVLDGVHFARHPAAPRYVVGIAAWRLNFFKKTPEQLLAPPPPDTIIEDGEMSDIQQHSPDDGHGH